MTSALDGFLAAFERVRPLSGIVLGSGLGQVASAFRITAALPFAEVPGLVAPTVAGHRGELLVGFWGDRPAVVCLGRLHFYEGNSVDRVVRLVNLLADAGLQRLLFTNAVGGIHPDFRPGDFMAIRRHVRLLVADDWKQLAQASESGSHHDADSPYSLWPLLVRADASIVPGTYAALTGPCYETPSEVRMLRTLGVDAVGMSTAVEAATANSRGMAVAGLSVVTNLAAGISESVISHHAVSDAANQAVSRLARVVSYFLDNE